MVVLISQEQGISPAEEARRATLVLDGGIDRYHLRKPQWSRSQYETFFHILDSRFYPHITLHFFHDCALFHSAAVHLRSHEYEKAALFDPAVPLSASCHSFDDIARCEQLNPAFAYLFLSPVYDSISKHGYVSAFSDTSLIRFFCTRKNTVSLIALGGVTEQRFPHVRSLGFSGAAVMGDFWQNASSPDDIGVRARQYRESWERSGRI
ncbi:MAG: thiamine phosphate synthase [Fibrobacterota bacterium]